MDNYLSNPNPFILSPVIKKKNSAPSLKQTNLQSNEMQPMLSNKSIPNFGSTLQNTVEKEEAKAFLKAKQGKEIIEKKRKLRQENETRRRSGSCEQDKSSHSQQQLEVTDLVLEYLGPYGKAAYQLSLMLLTYVGLLAYTQVFNSSFISQVWPESPVWFPAAVFGIIVVPLSCFDLAEQVTVQVLMSLLRFLSLGKLHYYMVLFQLGSLFFDRQ